MATPNNWINTNGGPFAWYSPVAREPYLMCAPDPVHLANVGTWIEICRTAKVSWLDWHRCWSWGDYRPDPRYYAGGLRGVEQMLEILKAAGIHSILHVYAFFVSEEASLPYPEDRIPFVGGGLSGSIPTSERLINIIAKRIAEVANLGFEGIYFDALSFCTKIEGVANSWGWGTYMLESVGEHLAQQSLLVETDHWRDYTWRFSSRRGSLDQQLGEHLPELAQRCIGAWNADSRLPLTIGWAKVGQEGHNPSDGELRSFLTVVKRNDAGFSFRGLSPSKWDDPRVREVAKIIGER